MSQDVVIRLLSSFSILENAINGAILSLNTREDVPLDILQRIESYSTLLAKQRQIAKELSASVASSDWADVARKIQLINGLLDLIRQDAKEIVGALKGEKSEEQMTIC